MNGGFAYKPVAPPHGSDDGANRGVLRAVLAIRERATEQPTDRVLHDLGVAYLCAGYPKRAIEVFEGLLTKRSKERDVVQAIEQSTDLDLLVDLSAAYLQRPQTFDYRLRAFAAADRAARLDSTSEAMFNRALALQKLGLREGAIEAWSAQIARDPNSDWADEARRTVAGLRAIRTEWMREAKVLVGLGLPQPVVEDSQWARTHVEDELLPEWGRLSAKGDVNAAAATLRKARLIAGLLTRVTGDRMAEAAIAQTTTERKAEAVAAFVAYGDAKRAFRQSPSEQARHALERAASQLSSFDCVLAFRARMFALTLMQYAGLNSEVADRAATLLSRLEKDRSRYPSVVGQIEWVAGLAESTIGNYEQALRHYRSARKTFARIHDRANEAGVAAATAECLRVLGYVDEAWQQSLEAADLSGHHVSTQRRYLVLTECMRMATEQRHPALARYLSDRVRRIGQESGDPALECDALLRQAELAGATGDFARALQVSSVAGQRATAIAATGLRDRIRLRVALQKAAALVQTDPPRALEELSIARQLAGMIELVAFAPETCLRESEALLRLNRKGEAIAKLRQGLEAYRQQAPTGNSRDRATFARVGRELSDRLIALIIDDDEHGAWEAAMAARDLPSFGPIERTNALIAYHILDDEFLIWIVRGDDRFLVRRKIPSNALRDRVEQLVAAVHNANSPEGSRPASEQLYDLLLQPVAARIRSASRVFIAGDTFIDRVPFAVLYDRESQRFAIEQTEFLFVGASGPHAPVPRRADRMDQDTLAIIGASTVSSLEPLPGVRQEVSAIAARWPRATVQVGADATRHAFLRAAVSHDIIHFAGHVTHHFDPALVALRLTADASSDGRVRATDLETLAPHPPALVVLSSCAAASGRPTPYGQLNLVQPLMKAGVLYVIASLWDVEDDSTHQFMPEFYGRLKSGRAASTALRDAQRAAIRRADAPSHWATFQIYANDKSLSVH
jgi:CHAT domain-containing protein